MTVPLCLRRDEFRLLLTHVEASSIVRNTNLHDLIQTEPGASGSASSIQTSSRLHVSRFCLAKVIGQLCWRVASLVSHCGLSISSLNFVLSIDHAVRERSVSISVPHVHKKIDYLITF
jgi:hypothetical protein